MSDKLRLGGMALRNGLLVHGPTHWAAAVRRRDGASGPKTRIAGVERLPGVRGVVRLGESLAVIPRVKRALPEAQLPFQNPTVFALMVGAGLAGAQLRRRSPHALAGELAATLVSTVPALAALSGGELAAYHGVEHKSIAAYEQDVEDAGAAAKEHDRCGSHLLAPMLTLNLTGTALLRRFAAQGTAVSHGFVALASAGAAVEVFVWSERHASNPLARALRRPGHALQRAIGTREPNATQLDVGRAALAEILRVEGVTGEAVPVTSVVV